MATDPSEAVSGEPDPWLDPLLVPLLATVERWKECLDSAAQASSVTVPDPLPGGLHELGRLRDWWGEGLNRHDTNVAEQLGLHERLGRRVPMEWIWVWQWQRNILQGTYAPIDAAYAQLRATYESDLVSARWRPADPTSDLTTISQEIGGLPYDTLEAVHRQLIDVETTRRHGRKRGPKREAREVGRLREAIGAALAQLRTLYRAEPTTREVLDVLANDAGSLGFPGLTLDVLNYRLRNWEDLIDRDWHWPPADEILEARRGNQRRNTSPVVDESDATKFPADSPVTLG